MKCYGLNLYIFCISKIFEGAFEKLLLKFCKNTFICKLCFDNGK